MTFHCLPNFLVILVYLSSALSSDIPLEVTCPQADFPVLTVDNHVTPTGNTSAGRFEKIASARTLVQCVQACCIKPTCEVVFFFNITCFLVTCQSAESCKPLFREGSKFDHSSMVKVRTPGMISPGLDKEETTNPAYNYLLDDNGEPPLSSEDEDGSDQLFPQETSVAAYVLGTNRIHACINGLGNDCPENEECHPKNHRARQGLCHCITGFKRNSENICIPELSLTSSIIANITQPTSPTILVTTPLSNVSTTQALHHIIVSAGENVTVQLPENSVSLSAYTLPKAPDGEKYKYEWNLVAHPEGDETGTMEDQNSDTLKLSKLRLGMYTFKVTVVGIDATGEASVNVTVIPPKRVNQPPVAVIQPSNATVKLPNKDTVLDGSFSKDDDKIVKYHWEAVNVPIGYQPQLADSPTLQLTNLVPGAYKFMLTVIDSDGVSNSTYSNLTVLKETDYPPTANAGPDQVIFLPQREVILNGSQSSDDKGIKSWEWTKSPDIEKPVDLEGTNTPYLHINQLEVGVYKFILKVTDTADQTSTAEVHVFVKPESNSPPVADAGPDQRVTLPLDKPIILDGSHSKDDIKIVKFQWEQIKGPKSSLLEDGDKAKAKVSGLIPGNYNFKLTVYDDKEAHSEALVNVIVTQTENSPPRANAGGDISLVVLPQDVVELNGNLSTDDVGIVKYLWSRDSSSLAAGDEIDNSTHSIVLRLTNLIPGRYLYRLTVFDSQGASSSDTASLIIKPPNNLLDQVELVINVDIKSFTQGQLNSLLKQLTLLLHEWDPAKVTLLQILPNDVHSNRVVLIFVLHSGKNRVPGVKVVGSLKKKLNSDKNLLDVEVLSVDTVVCQNECSGHGTCDPYTKMCICKTFWIEDFIRAKLGDKERNCDWSILYVILIPLVMLVLFSAVVWGCSQWCGRPKWSIKKHHLHRYTLLEEASDREKGDGYHKSVPHKSNSFKMKSNAILSTDSDSDVLFEKRRRMVNGSILSNGHVRPVNGISRDTINVNA